MAVRGSFLLALIIPCTLYAQAKPATVLPAPPIPCCRQSSTTGTPLSPCRRMCTVCSGVNLLVRIALILPLVEREISDECLQSPILVFEAFQPPRVAHVEPAVLGFLAIEGVLPDAVLAAERIDLLARLRLPEHANDLLLREPALPHVALIRALSNAPGSAQDRTSCYPTSHGPSGPSPGFRHTLLPRSGR
jgi:hypothetical protein